ncbi:MAG: hypothetical protein WCX46_04310 [Candidatus Paceibacterota bacterium]
MGDKTIYHQPSAIKTLLAKSNKTQNYLRDEKDAYSIIVPISNGYWCVNETGYAGNTSSKTRCPSLQ